jgi:hypothetical protein
MSSLIAATQYKAATNPRQVERLSFWLDDFARHELRRDAIGCRHLVKLAVGAGLLTGGEALAFYSRARRIEAQQ